MRSRSRGPVLSPWTHLSAVAPHSRSRIHVRTPIFKAAPDAFRGIRASSTRPLTVRCVFLRKRFSDSAPDWVLEARLSTKTDIQRRKSRLQAGGLCCQPSLYYGNQRLGPHWHIPRGCTSLHEVGLATGGLFGELDLVARVLHGVEENWR